MMYNFADGLHNVNENICDAIDSLKFMDRGQVSSNMLSECRNLVEHIAVLSYIADGNIQPDEEWKAIKGALAYLVGKNEYLFLKKFHRFLEQTRSHYTPDKEGAERLILKYYEYLIQCRNLVKDKFDLDILNNLSKFPISKDATLQEYYNLIADKLIHQSGDRMVYQDRTRFYALKQTPFVVDGQLFYEISFSSTNDEAGKFDRFVAFSKHNIPFKYAVQINYLETEIVIAGRNMPIKLIDSYVLSIRPCELNNFARIFGLEIDVKSSSAEYRSLMNYMGNRGLNLAEIVTLNLGQYEEFRSYIVSSSRVTHFLAALQLARRKIIKKENGGNLLKYLLFLMNNRVLRAQYLVAKNSLLSNLYLQNGCIPFETMPLCTSLINHNPDYNDVCEVIDTYGREHEVLAHMVSAFSTVERHLYIKKKDLIGFNNLNALIKKHNELLYNSPRHQARRIESFGNNLYVKQNVDTTVEVINKIVNLAQGGIGRYSEFFDAWLSDNPRIMDSDEKIEIIRGMFSNSRVALIYGAAGTGKSYTINHIAQLFDDKNKLFLANTHPAVDNLKRKIKAKHCEFSTIAKFTYSGGMRTKYDILFVDECSTVSNDDMVKIIEQAEFELLVLVGDIYQIESITFGNWFNMSRFFVPGHICHELTCPYRTQKRELLELWRKVREKSDEITEHIVHYSYSHSLDESIFDRSDLDEIVLCLNYDGLYGINNINRFLQNSNQNPPYKWGIWSYKVGNPVLFEETKRFSPVLYNNLKGVIRSIEVFDNRIEFSVEVDKVITELDAMAYDFDILDSANPKTTLVKFTIIKRTDDDRDDENNIKAIVPFRIAYAVSIHKAQGLEYNSVKVVITRETDEIISHNIFYTAITRTKNKLKIYWSPESQKKIIDSFIKDEDASDALILASHKGLKFNKRRRIN